MTLIAAWIKKISPCDSQLIVASDSRLSGIGRWDCCPKIMTLGRNDSVLAFCGSTAFAYPIMLQLSNAIQGYGKALSRELDITSIRPHFLRIINSMTTLAYDLPETDMSKEFNILFAGYSFRFCKFMVWVFYFDKDSNQFDYRNISFHHKQTKGTKPFIFMGDNTKEAAKRLYLKLKSKDKLVSGFLDMEPLDVLVEMIEDETFESIGGAPQIVKLYQYANVLPINVLWPRNTPTAVTYFGRPILSYEGTQYACVDLNNPNKLLAPYEANKKIKQ